MVDLKEWDSEKEGSEELPQAQGFVVNFTINGWSKQFKLGGFIVGFTTLVSVVTQFKATQHPAGMSDLDRSSKTDNN